MIYLKTGFFAFLAALVENTQGRITYQSAPAAQSPYKYDVRFVKQPVDHFNYQNHDTFSQKLLVNFDYWTNNSGPIFFYTGNEGPIEGFADNTGFIFDIAEQFKAGIVFAEHRYYGDSLPFGAEGSFKKEGLGYLSIEQAMADFAQIVAGYAPNKVIAFGGSYGGMLSAYMRYVYPHLIHGALAASAPIYYVAKEPLETTQTQSFFQAVTRDYTKITPACSAKLSAGFHELFALASNTQFDKFSTVTKQCTPVTTPVQAMHVLEWARNGFVMMAMMDYPYAATFMGDLPAWPVKLACEKAMAEKSPASAVISAASVFYGQDASCFDATKQYIHCADPTGCGLGLAASAWDYQACTQINLPEPSGYDMFFKDSFNATVRATYCNDKYGVKPNPDWLSLQYGRLNDATRIIYSNGDLDPWGPGGVHVDSERREIYALSVHDGAHHLDMRGKNEADPESVKVVRKREIEIIKSWLAEPAAGHSRDFNDL